ncbi:MAG TPA: hypothetical protein VK831_06585 [Candidatus Deferrimicrobiaceae bacterium]|nr:hypothetical protein [Candidatus Deferrimicrobiaceae bacterium]
MRRRTLRAVATAALLIAVAMPVVAAPAYGKTPGLTLVTDSTYDVLPDEGRVAITVRITARNRLQDTLTRRFFFRTASLAVLPGTSGFRISAATGSPTVSVRRRADDHTLLRIDLGSNLAAGRSRKLTLRFDLEDPGGPPERPVRISPSLVAFEAWAFATPDTAGSSVTVTMPAAYEATIGRGPLEGPTTTDDGRQAWASGRLDEPLAFAADVVAHRPSELVATSRSVELSSGEARIVLRSWSDDPGWRDRISDLVAGALPALEREIGLPWPLADPLVVGEARAGRGFDRVATFDPADGRLEVGYATPDAVVIEQLAHAWFNGRLVADRWIAEAFGLYYGERVAAALGLAPARPELTLERAALSPPLNAWVPAAAGEPADPDGRAAALVLARFVAARAGADGLAAVWSAAAAGSGAYQPNHGGDEPLPGSLDWRSLLDLLEDRTGRAFDDLWRTWVARPADLVALDARSGARRQYAALAARAGDWSLPRSVRDALRAWRFDLVVSLLVGAENVLDARDALFAEANALGLTLPDRLRRAFEGEDGFEVAEAEAAAQRAAVAAIREARQARATASSAGEELTTAVGLIGVDPEAWLAEASSALAAGDVDGAFDAATIAEDLWLGASGVGRGRMVSLGLLGLALVLLVGLVRQRWRVDR